MLAHKTVIINHYIAQVITYSYYACTQKGPMECPVAQPEYSWVLSITEMLNISNNNHNLQDSVKDKLQ